MTKAARRCATRPWTGHGLRRERWHGYLFIAPAFLFLAGDIFLPLGDAFWTSLLHIRGLTSTFVGLANYEVVLEGREFWDSLRISLVYTVVCVVAHLVIGFALALLIHNAGRLRHVLQLGFLVPWMVAPAIGATIWLWLLDPHFGVVNAILMAAGVVAKPPVWLGVPHLALFSVMLVDVWRGVPFIMLLLLAGLLGIPRDQYEAAALDGAGAVQKFRYVTLPGMRALLVIASTLDIIITVRQFDTINVMTAGGPVGATQVIPALIYNTAFRSNDFGRAAAIGVLLLILVLAFSSIYVALLRPNEEDA